MSSAFGKTSTAFDGIKIETQSAEQQIDDEWEKMHMDIEETENCQNRFVSSQIGDECDNMLLSIDNDERCQEIGCIPQIEIELVSVENQTLNTTNGSTCPTTHDQFVEEEKVHFGSNYDSGQSLSLDPQYEDDWEKMYANDDGTFIDDNSSCCSSSFGAFEFRNGGDMIDINHIIDGDEHEEESVDDQEDEIQVAAVDDNATMPVLPDGNERVNRDFSAPQSKVVGRRIVDVTHLFKQVQATGQQTEDCHFEDMILQHEIKNGMSSILVFKCAVCGVTSRVETDQKKRTALGINRDVVLGIYSVGLGFAHVEEVCANFFLERVNFHPNKCI